jgi:hypothetical protein
MCNPFGVGVVVLRVDPGCAAPPGLCCWTASQSVDSTSWENGARRMRTPTGFKIKARGRAAHPGRGCHASRANPNGVQLCAVRDVQRGSVSRECATPSGLVRWFCVWTRGALRDPGLCCWTASQSVDSATPGFVVGLLRSWLIQHPGKTVRVACEPQRGSRSKPGVAQRTPGEDVMRRARTPTGFNSALCATPNGFGIARMCNPFGVGAVVLRVDPGCAARPRAMLLDCFAVS